VYRRGRNEVKCQGFANVSEWEDFWSILELSKFESFEPFCGPYVKRGLQVSVRDSNP
jgi:hypothetical protein